MRKKHICSRISAVFLAAIATASFSAADASDRTKSPPQAWNGKDRVTKTESEWKKQLTAEQFKVTRKKGTERAFTGALNATKEQGLYVCAGCGLPLFSSEKKFDSGAGWPSYWAPRRRNTCSQTNKRSTVQRRR
jgi:peptide-methionine (R)-S-oxide reductase